MDLRLLAVVAIAIVSLPTIAYSQNPQRSQITFSIETIHMKKGELYVVRYEPDMKVEPIATEVTYHVAIPYVEDGVTKTRIEQRVRTVMKRPEVKKLIKLNDDYSFFTVAGTKLDREKFVSEFGDQPRRVINWPIDATEMPDNWNEFLNPNAIVMKEFDFESAKGKK